jgi:hypothetical protein
MNVRSLLRALTAVFAAGFVALPARADPPGPRQQPVPAVAASVSTHTSTVPVPRPPTWAQGLAIGGLVALGGGAITLITGLIIADSRCELNLHNLPNRSCTPSKAADNTPAVMGSGAAVMLVGIGLAALGFHFMQPPKTSTMKSTPKSWAMPAVAPSPRGAALRWTF